ncbi:uncharacterized protein BCR38DRAFT_297349, partial [Pseudomassariella vexata]
IILACLSLALTCSADCDFAFLTDATTKYINAQAAGDPTSIASLAASNVTYTENGAPLSISEGVLTEAIKIDHNRSTHDTVNCATFSEIIAASNPHPYVIGTRIIFSETSHKITLMESIVTDQGDWLFNATGYLYWNSHEKWDPIPPEKRDTREVIKAAGDAYFNRFDNTSVVVPFDVPCARLEGGAYTGTLNLTGDSCTLAGLPSTLVVTDRRYVVDETMGTVDIFLGFPGLDRSVESQNMPDSHFFRVESGKIRYIHTVSSCVNPGCGLNGTTFGRRRVRR